jgi:hypothetical protein
MALPCRIEDQMPVVVFLTALKEPMDACLVVPTCAYYSTSRSIWLGLIFTVLKAAPNWLPYQSPLTVRNLVKFVISKNSIAPVYEFLSGYPNNNTPELYKTSNA